MFIVLLKFSEGKAKANEFMAAHNQWVKRGFDEGVFLMAGSLQPGIGGVILAKPVAKDFIRTLVFEDPFVVENIVTAEILDVDPKRANEDFQFLLA